jgi:amino acid transporter
LGSLIQHRNNRLGSGSALFALGSPEAAGGYGSVTFVRILELVVLLDILAVGVGTAVAATRGVFAMARDRRLPAPLATVSSRYGTPLGSLVLLMVVQAGFILATEFWDELFALPETPHYFAIFVWGATFGGFALLVVYALMCLGSFRGFAGIPGMVGVFIAAIVGLTITAGAIFGSIYQVPSPTILAPVYALVWFAIGIVVMVFSSGRAPASTVLPDLATADVRGAAPPSVE